MQEPKEPGKVPTDEPLKLAQDNLERCLEALDRSGEAGLQAELDGIYGSQTRVLSYELETPEGIRVHVTEIPGVKVPTIPSKRNRERRDH